MERFSQSDVGPRSTQDPHEMSFPEFPEYERDPIAHCYQMIQRQFLMQGLPWIHSREARSCELPLRGLDTAGLCGHFSDLAKAILCQRHAIPEEAIVSHCMMEVQNAAGANTADRHAFLYLADAHHYFPSEVPYDEFIDFTSSQFAPDEEVDGDHAFDGLYENLIFHGASEGRNLCHSLFQRGAVRIEQTEAGRETLRLLIASYASFKGDVNPVAYPVEREDLMQATAEEMYHERGALSWLKGVLLHMPYIEV